MNQKVTMIQQAQRSEQEVRKKQAEAAQQVAVAEGAARSAEAQARGEAAAITLRAKAQAEANRILAESITPALIEYEKMRRWNGMLPTYQGTGQPLIGIKP